MDPPIKEAWMKLITRHENPWQVEVKQCLLAKAGLRLTCKTFRSGK